MNHLPRRILFCLCSLVLLFAVACSDDDKNGSNNQPAEDVGLSDTVEPGDDASGRDVVEDGAGGDEQDAVEPGPDTSGPDITDPDTAEPDPDIKEPEPDIIDPDVTEPDPDVNEPDVVEDVGGGDIIEDAVDDDAVDVEEDADTEEDTSPEPDPYEGRPIGQCTENADCPPGPGGSPGQCSRALPGGACMGCGDDSHCPGNAECVFSVCVTECSTTADCAPGLECNRAGQCRALPCNGDQCDDSLFICDTNFSSPQCGRADCSIDADSCPNGTTCVSGVCIEDRARN